METLWKRQDAAGRSKPRTKAHPCAEFGRLASRHISHLSYAPLPILRGQPRLSRTRSDRGWRSLLLRQDRARRLGGAAAGLRSALDELIAVAQSAVVGARGGLVGLGECDITRANLGEVPLQHLIL